MVQGDKKKQKNKATHLDFAVSPQLQNIHTAEERDCACHFMQITY